MDFDREKRIDTELNDDQVAKSDREVDVDLLEEQKRRPGKKTRLDLLLARIAQSSPGRNTLVEDLYRKPDFDECRALGLRDVLRSLEGVRGGKKLQDATLAAADPAIVRGGPGKTPDPSGAAMWRVAERRAATLYRNAVDNNEVTAEDPAVDAALARAGSGQALPDSVRKKMEAELDVPLDRVRVHTDAVAQRAARAVKAKAFTVGEDIFFAESEFAPDTASGHKLLAHELTHVVQAWQGRTEQGGRRVSDPNESLEREADAVADRVARAPRRVKSAKPGRRAAARKPTIVPRALSVSRGARLLRKAAEGDTAPRNQQAPANTSGKVGPNGERATVPTVRVDRDRGREQAEKASKGGTDRMTGAVQNLTQQISKASKTSLGQMKDAVSNTKANPPGKKAQTKGKETTQKAKKAALKAKDSAKKAKVETKNVKADPAASSTKGGGGGGSKIQFKKISSWDKFMPEPMADQDDRERKRILKLVKKRVEGDRKESQKSLEKLRAAQLKQASAVRGMKGPLQAQVQAAQAAAIGQVTASAQAQCGAVQSHVAAQQSAVSQHAGAMKGQVTAAHQAAMTAINTATRQANQKLQQAKTQALTDIQTAETMQLVVVAMQFLSCTTRITALGGQKASEAMGVPATVSWSYDGEKLEAAQKAAQEVASAYAAAMPEEAAKAAQQIGAEQPKTEADVRKIASDQREQVNKVFDQSKQVIEQAHEQAVTAANTAKEQALAQIDSASEAANQGLASHGQSQVAAIQQQATTSKEGITKAGTAAKDGIGKAVTQAATGIEKGATGLAKGAREVETPDPQETNRAVREGAQTLQQGASQVVAGLKKNATQSGTQLKQQATTAVQGMTATATSAKEAATQMASGAKDGMSQISQGSTQALQQIGEGHQKGCDQIVKGGEDGFKQLTEATRSAYSTATTQLSTALNNTVTDVGKSFGEAVPAKERADIIANGNKAADAVKPWWQKALAFVVAVVVAVVVVVVVTALIVTTGPVGAILVGAAAGALGSVAGQMASNLVLGNSLMDGVTWQSVAMGAIGGGLAAGLTAGLGAGATTLAAGGGRFAPAAARLGTALNGGAGLTNYGIRLGVNVGSDFASDAGAQLIVTGKYEFSAQNLVTSIATNAVTSTNKFSAVQQDVGGRVRAAVGLPPVNVSTGGVSPGGPSNTGGPGPTNTGGPGPTNTGGPGPTNTGGPGPTNTPTNTGGPGPTNTPTNTGGPTNTPTNTGGPTNTPTNTGGPTNTPANTGGPTNTPANTGGPTNTPANTGGPTNTPANTGGPTNTPTNHGGPNPVPDGPGAHPNTNEGGQTPRGDQTARPGDQNQQPRGNTDEPGQTPRGNTDEPAGQQHPAGPDQGAHPEGGQNEGGGNRGDGDGDGPSAADTELSDLGYPEGTRAKGDEAANAVEGNTPPNRDNLRDTQANQEGLRKLQELMNDPKLTPEQRQQAMRDLAQRMRAGEDPTGNLARDVAEARAQAEARAKVEAERAAKAEADRAAKADGDQTKQGDPPPSEPAAPAQTSDSSPGGGRPPSQDGPSRTGDQPTGEQTNQPTGDQTQQNQTQQGPEQHPLATSEETRQHIHEGGVETDVQSPYRGKWDGKGVHDWDTLQRIVARDGYRITSVTENPQTGVRRVVVERPQFKADKNGVMQPVLDANGVQRVGKIEKTIYPKDLAPGDIDAAGEAAIRAAMSGDSNTKLDQPDAAQPKKDGTPKDGYFEATVTVGNPPRQVRIQGWWKTGANGSPEITSHAPMRPQKDSPWPEVDPGNH